MKYLVLLLVVTISGCNNYHYDASNVPESNLICEGKLYQGDGKRLFVKCNDNRNITMTPGKYRLIMEYTHE